MTILEIVGIVIGVVVAVALIAVAIWLVYSYNFLNKLRDTVHEAFDAMNNSFKKRYDSVADVVKSAEKLDLKGEFDLQNLSDVLERARASKNLVEQVGCEIELSNDLSNLFALISAHDIHETDEFKASKNSITSINDEIDNLSKYYNASVKIFNAKRLMFPTNYIAKLKKIEPFIPYETEITKHMDGEK